VANHASAKKRIRQTEKRTLRNRHVRSTVRSFVKLARAAIAAGEPEAAATAVRQAEAKIRHAVSKGVYHPRTGSRYISRLAHQAASLSS